ncbi:VOC family protein [Paenibacillus sp. XY044]|uniref:VOC family protein n=1 Tax=Paenibacillus sp. XY044 TaxID=2026089 RepID=UPI000B97E443|nr:VOC family protein [Paenibacillus sp. XY044]OZB97603.1 dioxygenase [Paenibacillus sp. XY044]
MSEKHTLRGMATINYWADDVEAAVSWYSELLGIAPYFKRTGPAGELAYAEFRVGDYQQELGLVNRRFAPSQAMPGPGGAIMYWHVDHVEATLTKLLEMGAKEYEPVTPRGEGFVTASVKDPFGNVLGIMYNRHYLEMVEWLKRGNEGTNG